LAVASDPIAPVRAKVAGQYEIEREIGQGAFATVYLARDLRHDRPVAFKILNADPSSETAELRFIREIRLLARLQHPNILPLIDSGHAEVLLYYVMPYVSGETLGGRLRRERQLPVDEATRIAGEIADALAYAHEQGIVHRDIKPDNILFSAGHPLLADFGIARAIDVAGVQRITRTGVGSPGTPAYMSPEQLMGSRDIDARSDIYSLGCVLYEMLAGSAPFQGKDGFVKRFTEPPPVPSAAGRTLPSQLDAVVTKALAHEPRDRYTSASEFRRALAKAE
jgi:serine/threonine-protein kinase